VHGGPPGPPRGADLSFPRTRESSGWLRSGPPLSRGRQEEGGWQRVEQRDKHGRTSTPLNATTRRTGPFQSHRSGVAQLLVVDPSEVEDRALPLLRRVLRPTSCGGVRFLRARYHTYLSVCRQASPGGSFNIKSANSQALSG
jgi:hypothetical protein